MSSFRDTRMGDIWIRVARWAVREVRDLVSTLIVFIPLWLVFTGFVFELRSIPSESMVPALQVGDRVAVAKFAYGYGRASVPFGLGRFIPGDSADDSAERVFYRQPGRGDVVIFRHPNDDKVMVKRLVGLPGDTVQVRGGRLYLNGQAVQRTLERRFMFTPHKRGRPIRATEYRESLGEGESHLIQEYDDSHPFDNTPVFTVPEGHFFAMGDNRDNSQDSRARSGHDPEYSGFDGRGIGFVPMENLIGRGQTVLFTLRTCFTPPSQGCPRGRVWRGL